MADDRFACCRVVSIRATKPDKVKSCSIAISRNAVQNGSSRLTLVLWPEITTERLTIEDFITFPLAEACLGPPLNGQIGFRFQGSCVHLPNFLFCLIPDTLAALAS